MLDCIDGDNRAVDDPSLVFRTILLNLEIKNISTGPCLKRSMSYLHYNILYLVTVFWFTLPRNCQRTSNLFFKIFRRDGSVKGNLKRIKYVWYIDIMARFFEIRGLLSFFNVINLPCASFHYELDGVSLQVLSSHSPLFLIGRQWQKNAIIRA